MMRLVLFLILAFPICALSVSTNLPDGAYLTVKFAVTNSRSGDILNIPAGSWDWNNGITITNNISIIGAGNNATYITNDSGDNGYLFNFTMFTVPLPGEVGGGGPRISGLYIDGGVNQNGGFSMNGDRFTIAGQNNFAGNKITSFRVDHCTLANMINGGHGSDNGYGCFPQGYCNGLFDNDVFLNVTCPFQLLGIPLPTSTWGSQFPSRNGNAQFNEFPAPYYALGQTNNFYIESCYFTANTPPLSAGSNYFLVVSQYPAHWVFRYNTVSNLQNCPQLFDMHGNFQKDTTGANRGVPNVEIYNNHMWLNSSGASTDFIEQRGGTLMCFSNIVNGPSSAPIILLEEETCGCSLKQSYFPPYPTGLGCGWPAMDQVTNSFYWSNSVNIQVSPYSVMQSSCPNYFQQERDYFLHPPASTNAIAAYAPLVFPHPLVGASSPPLQSGGNHIYPNQTLYPGSYQRP